MSWQLGAFLVLGVALAAGFAWYERRRPDARIVAMVATLAALAALGRIAFAPLPNVKPSTDIVLIAGYALGGAPGFVVGALTALTSNFFFGQGPWTPWQMAGWGAVGILGAGLAFVTRRRIGRWPLALVCAAAGFAFTALQDVGDWVNFSDHSAASLRVYVAKGLGFDAIHAAGCLVFALAFGPALVHSLQRYGRRLQVTWRPAGTLGALVLAVGLAGGAGAALSALPAGGSGPATADAAATPLAYLQGAENRDGGFGAAAGQSSSSLFSGWAALGLAAAGVSPAAANHGGPTLIDYLRASSGSWGDVGSIERTILAARAAGVSARHFAGHDLVAALEGSFARDGSVSGQVNLTAFAVLALRSDGVAPPGASVGWIARQQDSDGGFNFGAAGGASDVDDTGAALQALGGGSRVAGRAISFIRAQQNPDGGFPSQPGAESNAQSTAWAVQGLLAAGVDPGGLRRGGHSPLDYLTSLIRPDGHIAYASGTDQTPVWVTAQALMALERKTLPLAPIAVAQAAAAAPVKPAARPRARVVVHRARAAAPRVRRHRRAAAAAVVSIPMIRLAGEAGLITALALAPVGAG